MNPAETAPEHRLMMSPMGFPDIGMSMAGLIQSVVQTNLRAIRELSLVNNPQDLVELQRRFASEYIAALRHGTMSLVDALTPDTSGGTQPPPEAD